MQAQLSDGARFLGMIRMVPTCSTSLACCETSFILLIRAVPLGSNFAFGFGAASNVLGMMSSSLDSVMGRSRDKRGERDFQRYATIARHATLGGSACGTRKFRRTTPLAAALRCVGYTTSIRVKSPFRQTTRLWRNRERLGRTIDLWESRGAPNGSWWLAAGFSPKFDSASCAESRRVPPPGPRLAQR
jgi:hypothetical protein